MICCYTYDIHLCKIVDNVNNSVIDDALFRLENLLDKDIIIATIIYKCSDCLEGTDILPDTLKNKFIQLLSDVSNKIKVDKQLEDFDRNVPYIMIHIDLQFVELSKQNRKSSFFRYADSSIWNYYCDGSKESFDMVINEILFNDKNGRYKLSIAREYQDFNRRKQENSYINGEHIKVRPFLFHSEKTIWEKLRDELNGKIGRGYRWRILIVDDKAEEGLSNLDGKSEIGKKAVILDTLQRLNNGYGATNKSVRYEEEKIIIDCCISKKKAIDKLKEERYDLILIDYNLQEKEKEENGQNLSKDIWGTDILDDICASQRNQDKQFTPSPAGEYNFMFISAYPTAVLEDMLSRGLYSQTDYWFVRRGACPTNTPWLFLYELHRMMDRRIESLSKHLKMIRRNNKFNKVQEKLQSPTALAFFEWLYTPLKVGEYLDIRNRCKNAFNAFLTLRSTYDKIKYDVYCRKNHKDKKDVEEKFVKDKTKESLLIRSMFPDVICYNNPFWEHMQHLVYLTAYGTNRQWSEMWEELLCVTDILNYAEREVTNENNSLNMKDINNTKSNLSVHQVVAKKIRDYILNLKHQN